MAEDLTNIDVETVSWKSIKQEGLDLDYTVAIPKGVASALFQELENTLEYFTGDLAKIKYDVIISNCILYQFTIRTCIHKKSMWYVTVLLT